MKKGKKLEGKEVLKREFKKNKEAYWMVGVMLGLVVLFFVSSAIFKSTNTFNYEGLTFTKERIADNILVYHYYKYYEHFNEIYVYNLFLRHDPRDLKDIPANGEIKFTSIKPVYISINGHQLSSCDEVDRRNTLAAPLLSDFLRGNLIKEVIGATPNIIESQARNVTYASCESKNEQVIVITDGEETRIDKIREGCYQISVADCRVLEATEKFIVQTIIDGTK